MKSFLRRYKYEPFITYLLVAINVILFLLCTFGDNMLYNIGRLSPDTFFLDKEYYRLITAMFLHADIQHLVNNMLLLFGLGFMLEKEVGHLLFAVLYFCSGLVGQAASLIYKILSGEWDVGSIGASGAVFGLLGLLLAAILVLGMQSLQVTPQRVFLVALYSIYMGMTNARIDNAAHVGGFFGGFFIGLIICLVELKKRRRR